MALDQLAIYNGALQLIGARRLASLTEDREPRYELDAIWDLNPAYYCGELVKPLFAAKLVKLDSPTTSTVHSFENVHTLPNDYVDIVSLHQDGKLDQLVERFVRDGNTILCDVPVAYLRYIDKSLLDDLTNWDQSFIRVVMAYMAFELAERIKPDAVEKIASIYQQRIEIATTSNQGDEPLVRPAPSAEDDFKLNIYNSALMAAGLPRLTSLNDESESRYNLDSLWALNPQRYCAEMVKPRFAARTVQLSASSPSSSHDLDNVFVVPADFVELVGVYSDSRLDQKVERFIRDGNTIACEYPIIYFRYINFTTLTDYNRWSASFARVVFTYLAKQLVADEMVEQKFQAAVAIALQSESVDEPAVRSNAPTVTLNNTWLNIYNDALLILGQDKIVKVDDDSQRRSVLDTVINVDLVTSVLEDIGWYWAITSERLTYNPSLEPEWGYKYAYRLPDDVHRFDGVWYDEYFRTPIRDYSQEGDVLFCGVTEIYIQYVSSNYADSPDDWKPSFRRYIAAVMARDTVSMFPGADVNYVLNTFEDRKREMYSLDAQQSPPLVLSAGSWSRSRSVGFNGRGRP